MAKYFFDCFDGNNFQSDAYGMEISELDEVADHGACLARELSGELTSSTGLHTVSVVVRSESGARVYIAHCSFNGLRLPEPS